MKLATAGEMKELDRRAIEEGGIPSIRLMDEAAAAVAAIAADLTPRRLSKSRVSILCGSGNNGGDGIAAARYFKEQGAEVRVFLVGSFEKLTPDAQEENRRLQEKGLTLEAYLPDDPVQKRFIDESDLLVDAIFGVGLNRAIDPDSRAAAAIAAMNAAPGRVIAVDIPSGVSADNGRVLGCAVRADRTVTFTLPKIGHMIGEGKEHSGELATMPIGIPEPFVGALPCRVQTVERDFLYEALPLRHIDGHKGTFGKVLLVGGSVGFTGAPWLMAEAAMRSGCGLVYLAVPGQIWSVLAAKCTGAMPFPITPGPGAFASLEPKLRLSDALAIGPGLGRSEESDALVRELLKTAECPVVLDADGLNAIADDLAPLDARRGRVTILTPHEGEFARLGGRVSELGRVDAARAFAVGHGCYVLLKGHDSVTASPDGTVIMNTTGGSGLSKGGSGDVLTGLITSLLAQGASPMRAAVLGAWLHGRAGDIAEDTVTAYCTAPEDIIGCFPQAFREIAEMPENSAL